MLNLFIRNDPTMQNWGFVFSLPGEIDPIESALLGDSVLILVCPWLCDRDRY